MDAQPELSEKNKIAVEDAEKFFMDKLDDVKFKRDIIRVPLWAYAENVITDSSTVLKVPLIYAGEHIPSNVAYQLLLIKGLENNSLDAVIEQIIVDSTYLAENNYFVNLDTFTGVKIYHDWFKGPMFGYKYEQGQKVSTIIEITQTLPNGRTQSGMYCTTLQTYADCTSTWTYSAYTGWTYSGKTCETIMINFTCGDETSMRSTLLPGGSGAYVQSMGQTLHPTGFDVTLAPPCIAGIVQDLYKAVSYQNYAANMAVNIMKRGANPFDVYKFFQEIYDPNSQFVIRLQVSDLEDDVTAVTNPWISSTAKERIAHVFIDKDYIKTATDLSIARTILHESIHAMILFGQKNYLGNDFKEVNKVIFTPNGLSSPDPDDHHEQMALTYINEMKNILKQFVQQRNITQPTSMTMNSYLEYLSWGGLDGTKAWKEGMKGNKTQARSIISNEANRNSTKGSRTSSC